MRFEWLDDPDAPHNQRPAGGEIRRNIVARAITWANDALDEVFEAPIGELAVKLLLVVTALVSVAALITAVVSSIWSVQ